MGNPQGDMLIAIFNGRYLIAGTIMCYFLFNSRRSIVGFIKPSQWKYDNMTAKWHVDNDGPVIRFSSSMIRQMSNPPRYLNKHCLLSKCLTTI